MNIINKILEFKLAIIFVFILGSLIKGQVVITELFITPTINIKIPQYIEIYNTSLTDTINLEGWLLKTYVLYDQGELESCTFTEIENSNSYLRINSNLLIPPNSYYLISSYSEGANYIFYNENKADIELFFKFYEINTLLSPCNGCEDVLVTGGKIILYELDDDEKLVEHDIVVFDSNNWVINEDSWGHSFSLRGEPNISFNDFSENWFLSPVTERSLYLGEDYNQIQNYGSPKEENSFNLLYPLQDSIIVINNDVNNFHSINNYNDPLLFTWDGTFDDYIGQKYRLIINKLDSWSPNYHGQLTDIIYQNINILDINILDIDTLIMLEDLSINQLEKSNYNWTVELIKGVDTIYSDLSYFSIDASDYGQYGCIDDGCCTDDITLVDPIDDCPRICPTNNIDEFFVSN